MFRGVVVVIVMAMLVGCAHSQQGPVTPRLDVGSSALCAGSNDGPYRLWGEWTLFIPPSHDRVDLVPRRGGRFHLNALKFLEEYCTNCLEITKIKNNGDGTIDLTVKITHPFPGFPQYTGFDVKGIIMFNGSYVNEGDEKFPPYPEPFRVSWRKLGDPQVMNADGFTLRWSPSYDSGLPQPIFNYWEGKYATGVPTANLNAYKDFYTNENRHIFAHYGEATRTYRIWLPPGEAVVAGYAVEACWELPVKMPVTDPINDFPSTANQPEAYSFYYNVNNGEPITDPDCCGDLYDPSTAYMYSKQWGGHTATHFAFHSDYSNEDGVYWNPCGDEWPDMYCVHEFHAVNFPDGDYIGIALNYHLPPYDPRDEIAYSVFEFTIDLE